MYKKLFYSLLVLWVITVAVFAKFFISGATSKSTDQRLSIHLAPSEKDIVLGEMRIVLKAVNGALRNLGQSNFKEASIEVKKAGKAMAADINPVLMAKLPLEFKQLGISMHEDFDKFSADLDKGMTEKEAITELGAITNKCIACHATYRLE
ncbi:MAG: hypothetical protein WC635_11650 [Bacteriovorax sp.]|jgi:hypothetical protein